MSGMLEDALEYFLVSFYSGVKPAMRSKTETFNAGHEAGAYGIARSRILTKTGNSWRHQ